MPSGWFYLNGQYVVMEGSCDEDLLSIQPTTEEYCWCCLRGSSETNPLYRCTKCGLYCHLTCSDPVVHQSLSEEEAKQFDELAAYFTKIVRPINDATVEKLAESLKADLENYPALRATCDSEKDRGAARVCVWGEKVTRMLESLVSRYLKEGDRMAEGTSIWVCSVCGFVYIGDRAPDLCPVCKVPAWKFDKVEGR